MPAPLWKPDPRPVDKVKRRRVASQAVERMKTKVRQFHNYRCCVCRRPTRVVHEHLARSLRGPVSLENSFLACDAGDGGICHPLLQQHKIRAYNTGQPGQDARAFNARKPITFEVPQRYVDTVFADQPMPSYIRVVC